MPAHAAPRKSARVAPETARVRARDAMMKSPSPSRPIPIQNGGAGLAMAEPARGAHQRKYDWDTWQMYTLITGARERRAQTTSDPESQPRPQPQQQPQHQSQLEPQPPPQLQPQGTDGGAARGRADLFESLRCVSEEELLEGEVFSLDLL